MKWHFLDWDNQQGKYQNNTLYFLMRFSPKPLVRYKTNPWLISSELFRYYGSPKLLFWSLIFIYLLESDLLSDESHKQSYCKSSCPCSPNSGFTTTHRKAAPLGPPARQGLEVGGWGRIYRATVKRQCRLECQMERGEIILKIIWI